MPEQAGELTISLTINGRATQIRIDPSERLLDTLRYRCGLTGTKEGCGEGECGACTIHMNGVPVNSCLVPSYQAQGAAITTIEGVDDSRLGPLLRSGATQCGACTPGVVMCAMWLVDRGEAPDRDHIRAMMAGNLCRCTGYDGIIDGVMDALRGGRESP